MSAIEKKSKIYKESLNKLYNFYIWLRPFEECATLKESNFRALRNVFTHQFDAEILFLLINIVFLTVMHRFAGEGCLCLWKSKLLLNVNV